MPKCLAEAANDELAAIAKDREGHEMRNAPIRSSDNIEAALPDGEDEMAWEHKPIKRGSAHTGGQNGGEGRKGELAKRGGRKPD